jgi:hypothetical protein
VCRCPPRCCCCCWCSPGGGRQGRSAQRAGGPGGHTGRCRCGCGRTAQTCGGTGASSTVCVALEGCCIGGILCVAGAGAEEQRTTWCGTGASSRLVSQLLWLARGSVLQVDCGTSRKITPG